MKNVILFMILSAIALLNACKPDKPAPTERRMNVKFEAPDGCIFDPTDVKVEVRVKYYDPDEGRLITWKDGQGRSVQIYNQDAFINGYMYFSVPLSGDFGLSMRVEDKVCRACCNDQCNQDSGKPTYYWESLSVAYQEYFIAKLADRSCTCC
jgi:hypothetical protein